MTRKEMEEVAEIVADKLSDGRVPCCTLTDEEQAAIRDILKTKRSAVRLIFYVFSALALYALKDVYIYIVRHLSFE